MLLFGQQMHVNRYIHARMNIPSSYLNGKKIRLMYYTLCTVICLSFPPPTWRLKYEAKREWKRAMYGVMRKWSIEAK